MRLSGRGTRRAIPVSESPVAGARRSGASSLAGAHPLDCVLRPKSVVIVGASADPTKRGNRAALHVLIEQYHEHVAQVELAFE